VALASAVTLVLGLGACGGPLPAYTVDRSSPDWVVTFSGGGVVRAHLKCDSGEASFITEWVGPAKAIHIKPGQWLEWVGPGGKVISPPDLRNC
jgi:hypothetical protein